MTLKEKLDLWVKITGVNPSEDNRKYTIYMDGRLSNYDIQKMNERIMNSLKYDETGLFADTYLKIYLKKFMNGKNVSFMGAHAFCLNKKLEKIVFRGTKLKQLRKPHVFIEVKHAKVYVPKRKYKAYKKMLSDYGLNRCKFVKK